MAAAVAFLFAAALSSPIDPAVARARALLANMTLDEKIALTHGTGWGQNTTVPNFPRHFLPFSLLPRLCLSR